MTAALLDRAARAAIAELEAADDVEFGVRLLRNTPTHERRDPALLRHWAATADAFGAGLEPVAVTARIVESDGGLARGLLARYTSRPVPTVELFTDTLALADELIDLLGWRHWYPAGSVRAAAVAHEACTSNCTTGRGRRTSSARWATSCCAPDGTPGTAMSRAPTRSPPMPTPARSAASAAAPSC
ncbi:hypothetical protein GA0115280_100942 [Streptomyces sp. Cmuel-A718b]|nr:hypothetical protein GA0115280_100942 [Streptomyces sp. Cmuel-A718b]